MVQARSLRNLNTVDPDEIKDYWKYYFQDLYTPKDLHVYVDNEYKNVIQNAIVDLEYESFLHDDGCVNDTITCNRVVRVVIGLKCNKVPGWDAITSEHILVIVLVNI